MPDSNLPLIYSCSGCSNVAQMANYIALKLTQKGVAEMSCIAGVGGQVPALVKRAQRGSRIIAIDGCPLDCCKACLKQIDVEPEKHIRLNERGCKKILHERFDEAEADALCSDIEAELLNEAPPAAVS